MDYQVTIFGAFIVTKMEHFDEVTSNSEGVASQLFRILVQLAWNGKCNMGEFLSLETENLLSDLYSCPLKKMDKICAMLYGRIQRLECNMVNCRIV